MIFFRIRIRILLFSWFRIGILFRILPYMNFSHIFYINLTFVFPSFKCVSCILWRDKNFLGKFLCYKKEFKFFNLAFLLRNCQILSVFQSTVVLLQIHSDPELPGSVMIFSEPVNSTCSHKIFKKKKKNQNFNLCSFQSPESLHLVGQAEDGNPWPQTFCGGVTHPSS